MWFYIVVLHLGCIILTIFIFHQGRSLFPELQQSWKLFGEKQPSCAKKKKKTLQPLFPQEVAMSSTNGNETASTYL